MKTAFCMFIALLAACTSRNPHACDQDSDCKDSTAPFCDIKGEFPESHYTANSCSAVPATCPVERCGCTPGATLACANDQATVCGADGKSSSALACPLGCSATETRCATFDPSNGLADALADAGSQPDVLFPSMVHIDTELGIVQDTGGNPIAVKTALVAQNGGTSMIRVLEGKSFVIDSAVVSGPYALAIVAPGQITIRGLVDASANGTQPGPGAQDAPAVCVGSDAVENCYVGCTTVGAGGGGGATPGGQGGFFGGAGGAVIAGLEPLLGGCRGGSITDNGSVVNRGGAGGGALQVVSLTEVALTTSGFIDVSGGGGNRAAGGGSSGNVVIEAPTVRLEGVATGIAANGGAGGACGMAGPDGTAAAYAAAGPRCSPNSAGDGGTGATAATSGENCPGGQTCALGYEGGGGGAAGRLQISTRDGNFVEVSNPVISAVVTTYVLTTR